MGAHGIRGQVKVRPFTQMPQDLLAYGPLSLTDGRICQLKIVRLIPKGLLIAQIEGVADRTQAEGFKGQELFVERNKMPNLQDDEFYIEDLVGLSAQTEKGEVLGRVTAVSNYGAGDFLELTLADGSLGTIAFVKEAVLEIASDHVVVDPEQIIV